MPLVSSCMAMCLAQPEEMLLKTGRHEKRIGGQSATEPSVGEPHSTQFKTERSPDVQQQQAK